LWPVNKKIWRVLGSGFGDAEAEFFFQIALFYDQMERPIQDFPLRCRPLRTA
jgi:hypothetical protein